MRISDWSSDVCSSDLWEPAFGGDLELWDAGMKHRVRAVAPVFNRCVVFNTDSDSYHGHPDPLTCPEDRSRRSIALYYYTASPGIQIGRASCRERGCQYV